VPLGRTPTSAASRTTRASSATIVGTLGGLHILVNNAGIIRRANAIDFTEADWDAVLDVNLKSVFFLSQAAARHMIPNGGGKIINIASMLSFQGGIRVPSYTASKSGIAGLTRLLANEWASQGINVNAIAPATSPPTTRLPCRPTEAQCRRSSAASRPALGRSRELGGAAVFLASSAANYVQGIILPVDGGWLAR
jgi:2-deoxy-D-gluconate 3-dehydrogenase